MENGAEIASRARRRYPSTRPKEESGKEYRSAVTSAHCSSLVSWNGMSPQVVRTERERLAAAAEHEPAGPHDEHHEVG